MRFEGKNTQVSSVGLVKSCNSKKKKTVTGGGHTRWIFNYWTSALKGLGLSSWHGFEKQIAQNADRSAFKYLKNLQQNCNLLKPDISEHICMARHHLFFVIWLNRVQTRTRAKPQDRVRAIWSPLGGEKPQLKEALMEGGCGWCSSRAAKGQRRGLCRTAPCCFTYLKRSQIGLILLPYVVFPHLNSKTCFIPPHTPTHTHISTYLYSTHQTENFIAIMQLSYLYAINFLLPMYTPWEQRFTVL